MTTIHDDEELECLDDHGENTCRGPIEYHTTGQSLKAWPRCEFHQERRQARYDDPSSSERLADSDLPPSDFHRGWGGANDVGEYWSEDDY